MKDGKPDVLPGFMCSMSVYVVLVNPETDAIDDDKKLNTATRIWLEAGPWGLPAELRHQGPALRRDLRARHPVDKK